MKHSVPEADRSLASSFEVMIGGDLPSRPDPSPRHNAQAITHADSLAFTSMLVHTSMIIKLYKIWSFHGSDYEECRLLGFKNPFRTSQETHYFSTTQSSRLMLCNISGCHGSDYEECRLLGYTKPISYFTGDTLLLRYTVQPVNAM
jgi:hypothetical protein